MVTQKPTRVTNFQDRKVDLLMIDKMISSFVAGALVFRNTSAEESTKYEPS